MQPNYHNGDRLIVATHGYTLEQGSVVVMTNVLDEPIIKRVIAMEGQTVDIDYSTGIVYVDGKAVDEKKFGLQNGITTSPSSAICRTFLPPTVLGRRTPRGAITSSCAMLSHAA